MNYDQYLTNVRAEVARRVGWTPEQASVAVGNVIASYERSAPLDEAVEDVLADVFND